DRCDVLIALWDGQPARGRGGTAEVVALARRVGRPLICIGSEPPFAVTEELGDGLARTAFARLDAYNRARVDPAQLAAEVAGRRRRLEAAGERAGLPREGLAPFYAWSLPSLTRAGLLARRFQRR